MAVGLTSLGQQAPTSYFEEPIGGTSLSTPLVAGIVADAEQGRQPFGFLNPALYRLAGTSALHDPRPLSYKTPSRYRGVACDADLCGILLLTAFDDQSWSMEGYTGQVTAPGYDTMSGVGTPNGQKFIAALRGLESSRVRTIARGGRRNPSAAPGVVRNRYDFGCAASSLLVKKAQITCDAAGLPFGGLG
jgi:hypothetical protein